MGLWSPGPGFPAVGVTADGTPGGPDKRNLLPGGANCSPGPRGQFFPFEGSSFSVAPQDFQAEMTFAATHSHQPLSPSYQAHPSLSGQPLEGATCGHRASALTRSVHQMARRFFIDSPFLFATMTHSRGGNSCHLGILTTCLAIIIFPPPEAGKRHACFRQHTSGHTLICQYPSENKRSKSRAPVTHPPYIP